MRALVAIALAACSQPAPTPTKPTPVPAPLGPAMVPVDAPLVSQDEKLAAIQKAMNELDEAAQGCWAAAATDRFDIEGELTFMIDIAATSAKATVVADTTRNAKLATCVTGVLGGYRWAPPLHGETIQLPFRFRAPDGQSVIDRQLVEWHGQQNTSIAVLIDENNTGNAAASILEVALAPGAGTGMRVAERAELWYFLGEADVNGVVKDKTPQNAPALALVFSSSISKPGTMMFVPAGSSREVVARSTELHAVVVVVPGGREGSARAGALPTPVKAPNANPLKMFATGKQHGPAMIFLEPAVVKDTPLAASILQLGANAKVAEHAHANETELLYVLEGSGTLTINGQAVAVTATSVIQIPANTKHAFAATTAVRALQIYTPAGPEQRFKKP